MAFPGTGTEIRRKRGQPSELNSQKILWLVLGEEQGSLGLRQSVAELQSSLLSFPVTLGLWEQYSCQLPGGKYTLSL